MRFYQLERTYRADTGRGNFEILMFERGLTQPVQYSDGLYGFPGVPTEKAYEMKAVVEIGNECSGTWDWNESVVNDILNQGEQA